jgi:hypothetical protein
VVCRARRLRLAAALRVIRIRRNWSAALSDGCQPALGVVPIREGTVKGQISVAIVCRRHRANCGVLVETVCTVA